MPTPLSDLNEEEARIFVQRTLGPYLAGICAQTLMMGFLTLQAWNYFMQFHNDHRIYKLLVAALFLTGVMQAASDFYLLYRTFVIGYGRLDVWLDFDWATYYGPAWNGLVIAITQAFFLNRCYTITKSKAIVVICVFGIVTQLAASIAVSIGLVAFNTVLIQDIIWLGSSAATDVVISATLILHLHKAKTGFQSTERLLMRVIRLSFETATFTAAVAMANLIAAVAFADVNGAHFFFQFIIGKSYSLSVMVTLLARRRLGRDVGGIYTSSGQNGHETSNGVIVTTTSVRVVDEQDNADRIPMKKMKRGITFHEFDPDKIVRIV